MGSYRPSEPRQRRSMSEMFSEAEDEHFLDCPTADFFIRCGSILLDAILFFLVLSGVQHISQTVGSLLPKLPSVVGSSPAEIERALGVLGYLTIVAKLLLIYGYFLWPVATFRGTPAKLLLGLRVVDASSGGRPSFLQVMLREILGRALCVLVLGGGFALPLLRADQRALHDLISRTVVKRVHGGP